VEPGILGEYRLSAGNGCAAFPDDILLAVSFFWFFIQVNKKAKLYEPNVNQLFHFSTF